MSSAVGCWSVHNKCCRAWGVSLQKDKSSRALKGFPTKLGWEFQFLVPISGTPIERGIPLPFLIPKITVGFIFSIPLLKNQEIRIPIPKFGIPKKKHRS
jgi:hypothetical protein